MNQKRCEIFLGKCTCELEHSWIFTDEACNECGRVAVSVPGPCENRIHALRQELFEELLRKVVGVGYKIVDETVMVKKVDKSTNTADEFPG